MDWVSASASNSKAASAQASPRGGRFLGGRALRPVDPSKPARPLLHSAREELSDASASPQGHQEPRSQGERVQNGSKGSVYKFIDSGARCSWPKVPKSAVGPRTRRSEEGPSSWRPAGLLGLSWAPQAPTPGGPGYVPHHTSPDHSSPVYTMKPSDQVISKGPRVLIDWSLPLLSSSASSGLMIIGLRIGYFLCARRVNSITTNL